MLSEALERMPHAGPMRLIAGIVSADEERIECIATDHRDAGYPLRIDGVLHVSSLVELGAQAAAAHTSIHGIGTAHTGLVVALNNVDLARDRVEDEAPLTVRAVQLQTVGDAATYRFEVSDAAGIVVAGEVLLQMQRRDA